MSGITGQPSQIPEKLDAIHSFTELTKDVREAQGRLGAHNVNSRKDVGGAVARFFSGTKAKLYEQVKNDLAIVESGQKLHASKAQAIMRVGDLGGHINKLARDISAARYANPPVSATDLNALITRQTILKTALVTLKILLPQDAKKFAEPLRKLNAYQGEIAQMQAARQQAPAQPQAQVQQPRLPTPVKPPAAHKTPAASPAGVLPHTAGPAAAPARAPSPAGLPPPLSPPPAAAPPPSVAPAAIPNPFGHILPPPPGEIANPLAAFLPPPPDAAPARGAMPAAHAPASAATAPPPGTTASPKAAPRPRPALPTKLPEQASPAVAAANPPTASAPSPSDPDKPRRAPPSTTPPSVASPPGAPIAAKRAPGQGAATAKPPPEKIYGSLAPEDGGAVQAQYADLPPENLTKREKIELMPQFVKDNSDQNIGGADGKTGELGKLKNDEWLLLFDRYEMDETTKQLRLAEEPKLTIIGKYHSGANPDGSPASSLFKIHVPDGALEPDKIIQFAKERIEFAKQKALNANTNPPQVATSATTSAAPYVYTQVQLDNLKRAIGFLNTKNPDPNSEEAINEISDKLYSLKPGEKFFILDYANRPMMFFNQGGEPGQLEVPPEVLTRPGGLADWSRQKAGEREPVRYEKTLDPAAAQEFDQQQAVRDAAAQAQMGNAAYAQAQQMFESDLAYAKPRELPDRLNKLQPGEIVLGIDQNVPTLFFKKDGKRFKEAITDDKFADKRVFQKYLMEKIGQLKKEEAQKAAQVGFFKSYKSYHPELHTQADVENFLRKGTDPFNYIVTRNDSTERFVLSVRNGEGAIKHQAIGSDVNSMDKLGQFVNQFNANNSKLGFLANRSIPRG